MLPIVDTIGENERKIASGAAADEGAQYWVPTIGAPQGGGAAERGVGV